jgi:hypothetical protein
MGKVYGLHRLELRPGANVEAFERFVRETLPQLPPLPGWRFALLKGERGEQVGAYLFLVEIDSLAERDRVSLPSGLTEEGNQWIDKARPLLEQWRQYTQRVPGLDTTFTDFHDIST